MAPPPPATGWPFLVAPGRRRDYAILLAPDFLVADLDHGVLEHVVRPATNAAPAAVVEARSGHGRRLTVVSATHLLTAADIASGGATRDEHGRPLRLVYGFASLHTGITEPAEADLHTARECALEVYRRFLDNEERAGVIPSYGFALRTRTGGPVPPPATAAVRTRAGRPVPVLLLGAVAAVALALTAIVLGSWSGPPAQTHTPCPAVASAGRPTPSPGVSPPNCSPTAPPSPAPAGSHPREEQPHGQPRRLRRDRTLPAGRSLRIRRTGLAR